MKNPTCCGVEMEMYECTDGTVWTCHFCGNVVDEEEEDDLRE